MLLLFSRYHLAYDILLCLGTLLCLFSVMSYMYPPLQPLSCNPHSTFLRATI
jgi:hypothetical protein